MAFIALFSVPLFCLTKGGVIVSKQQILKRLKNIELAIANKKYNLEEIIAEWLAVVRQMICYPDIQKQLEEMPYEINFRTFAENEEFRKQIKTILKEEN